jgi:hypothetical protein
MPWSGFLKAIFTDGFLKQILCFRLLPVATQLTRGLSLVGAGLNTIGRRKIHIITILCLQKARRNHMRVSCVGTIEGARADISTIDRLVFIIVKVC